MSLLVIDPGFFTTIQDGGRPGHREWGVPLGGAFDRGSADLANALVGNPSGCAVLEMTLVGGQFQADCPMALALAGATLAAKLTSADSSECPVLLPSSLSLGEGDRLIVGRTATGARTYLAVKGGWQTRMHMNSRSSEKRLQVGEILPAASGTIASRRLSEPAWRSPTDDPFRIIAGPDSRFHPDLDEAFWASRQFTIGSQSNRMGLRLQGEPVSITSPPERLSTPIAPGAVQAAGGQLIVMGVACGTMGGYPHVAHVITADQDRLGQLKPGDAVTFRQVTLEEARSLDQAARQIRRAVLRRLAMLVGGE
jgi:5-oxoprolinase (ATP-hydrolysing) subunit C